MRFVLDKSDELSRLALRTALISVAATVVLSIVHGLLQGDLRAVNYGSPWYAMAVTWCVDFRILFEQLIYAGAIVFIGAKFIETRSIFTVGFDKLDAAKVSMKGPDDDNIVWIGHRYGTRMEADIVATTIESRLKESVS
ncbi:MAG: hypothetical protein KGL29_15485 [Alphaproteobacteria bacterium]|nr:hypothetical protein [Alphaproteobacteria bacterium]MDE2267305.1 hypothetical protein [Alphaproteobacteria bacterium]